MGDLLIRNVDAAILEELRRLAIVDRRSVQQVASELLARAVLPAQSSPGRADLPLFDSGNTRDLTRADIWPDNE